MTIANMPGDAQLEALKANLAMTMTQMSVNLTNIYSYADWAYGQLPANVMPNHLYKPIGDGIGLVKDALNAVNLALAGFK